MNIVDDIVKRYDNKTNILQKLARFFNRNLLFNQSALNYCLIDRGWKKSSIDEFLIGYDDNKLQEFIKREKIDIDFLVRIGVFSKNADGTYYNKFSKRVIFPIFDLKGNIAGFTSRVWKDNDTRSKYVNTSLSDVYQKSLLVYGLYQAVYDILMSNLVLVVEGNPDVISCHQEDIKIAVSACGTSFMDEHFLILRQFTNRFIFCFDDDEGGEKSIVRIKEMLKDKKDIKVGYLQIDGVNDLDELIREFGADSLKKSILNLESKLQFV